MRLLRFNPKIKLPQSFRLSRKSILIIVLAVSIPLVSVGSYAGYKYFKAGQFLKECERVYSERNYIRAAFVCEDSANYWFRQHVENKADKAMVLYYSHKDYLAGLKAFSNQKWEVAIDYLSKVNEDDLDYADAIEKLASAKTALAAKEKSKKVAGVKDNNQQSTLQPANLAAIQTQNIPKPPKDSSTKKRISNLENKVKSIEQQQNKPTKADTPVGISLNQSEISAIVELFCVFDNNSGYNVGSGTVVDSSGLIYTNRHVVQNPNGSVIKNYYTCLVGITSDISKLSQIKYWATLIMYSPSTDVAILFISDTCVSFTSCPSKVPSSFPYLTKGSSGSLSAGENVWVAGYPVSGDGTWTLTKGIISGKSGTMFKTDAQIDNGNSGGAVLNKNKKLIGIPTAYIAGGGETLGYFIGIDQVNSLSDWVSIY